jgi:hypothetical protein
MDSTEDGNDALIMSWLQSQAMPQGSRKADPQYQALPNEGKAMADSFLDAFFAARTPTEFGSMFFGSPEEEPETITADTAQSLSFEDLVNALDKISEPTTVIDVLLPFDPDDFTVV